MQPRKLPVQKIIYHGMANNVSAIGQAPTRWVANIFLANFIICATLIIINAI